MKFIKMQAAGNDYVYVDCFKEKIENPGEIAIKVSDRHFGVGSDGLILICPSDIAVLCAVTAQDVWQNMLMTMAM